LKVNAVQWFYLLLGLRDGHLDVVQKLEWVPWTGKGQKQVCAGRAVRIQLARIIPDETGRETVALVFERLTTYATRTEADRGPQFEYPIYQVIKQDTDLPPGRRFGLKPTEHPSLFFPAVPSAPVLWKQLKRPRSIKELQHTLNNIDDWLVAAVPGVSTMPQFRRALCDRPAELFWARKLWNYPRTNRPTSDDKRIEFFAEALAGLMLGVAPATATKKLLCWSPPKLWLTKFEGDQARK